MVHNGGASQSKLLLWKLQEIFDPLVVPNGPQRSLNLGRFCWSFTQSCSSTGIAQAPLVLLSSSGLKSTTCSTLQLCYFAVEKEKQHENNISWSPLSRVIRNLENRSVSGTNTKNCVTVYRCYSPCTISRHRSRNGAPVWGTKFGGPASSRSQSPTHHQAAPWWCHPKSPKAHPSCGSPACETAVDHWFVLGMEQNGMYGRVFDASCWEIRRNSGTIHTLHLKAPSWRGSRVGEKNWHVQTTSYLHIQTYTRNHLCSDVYCNICRSHTNRLTVTGK